MEAWWRSEPDAAVDPFTLYADLYRPLAVLWDGRRVWVGLAGYRADVDDQATRVLARVGGFEPVAGPPRPPVGTRRSLPPASLPALPSLAPSSPATPGTWLAEIGVGVVHCDDETAARLPARPADPGVVELHRRLAARFDPTGRLNPGRSPLRTPAAAGISP